MLVYSFNTYMHKSCFTILIKPFLYPYENFGQSIKSSFF